MKTLYQILEARARVQELPFTREEFKRYCPDGWDCEDEFIKEIDDRIKAKFGEKAWRTFNGWVEGNWYGADLDVLYDILLNVPMSRLDKLLGAGSYGIVIDCGDRVIKWFHKNTPLCGEDERFYNWCLEHPKSKVFPVVYKTGENYVVMEKLKTWTPKCKLYDKYLGFSADKIDVNGKPMKLEDIIYDPSIPGALDAVKKDRKVYEIYKWGVTAIKYLKEATGFSEFSDLRLANIGERNNGEVVWFDI